MKKVLAMILALAMSFGLIGLVGCGQTAKTASSGTQTPKQELPIEPITLKFCCSESETSIMYQEMKKAFAAIKERTNGALIIEGFPANQLGSITDMQEQMQSGAPLIIPNGFDNTGTIVKGFDATSFPYMFSDIYDVYALAKSDWMAEQEKKMQEAGVTALAYGAYGYRNWIGNFAINSAADIKGHIIRMGPSAAAQGFIDLMGGSPTTSTWADNYSLIETGVIDACEAAVDLLWSSSLQEVCDYLNLSEHFVTPVVVLMNNEWWHKIPADHQAILRQEFQAAEIAATDAAMKQYKSIVQDFKDAGVTVLEPDKKSFAEYVPALFEKLGIDIAVYDEIQVAIAENK